MKSFFEKIKYIYENEYKKLLIIPLIIIVFSFAQISYQYYTTGSLAEKDLSLKGGYFIKLEYTDKNIVVKDYISSLKSDLSLSLERDLEISEITNFGKVDSILIETELKDNVIQSEDIALINQKVSEATKISQNNFLSTGLVNAALGNNFFRQTIISIIIAFLFMSAIVFIYFSEDLMYKFYSSFLTLFASYMIYYHSAVWSANIASVLIVGYLIYMYITKSMPSFAVMSCAFADIIVTLAVFNVLGYKLSTAGIAAFLMLIGYSVDTDILLSTKLLKQRVSAVNINENIYSAITTGMTMTLTTLVAVIIALFVAKSAVIQQIMVVLLIGLFADIINTWITNVAILRWYLEYNKV